MNKQHAGTAAAAAVAAVAMTLGVQSLSSGGHQTLGDALAAGGYVSAVSRIAGSPVEVQPIDYSAPLDWANYGAGTDHALFDVSFFARYRMHTSERFGSPFRGMTCRPARSIDVPTLEKIARHRSNPLGLADNTAWEADRTDLEDLRWATMPASGCGGLAVDTFIFPAGCSAGVLVDGCPTPEPTPEPTSPPPPTPDPPPTPTPAPPAGWRYGWSVRQVECVGGVQNSLCLDLRFSPSVISTGTGGVSLEVVE